MTSTREQRREYNRAYMRARRLKRKLAQRCLWCNAGLQEDDGSYCVECEQVRRKHDLRRRREGWQAERAEKRRSRGECIWCRDPVATRKDGKPATLCAPCLEGQARRARMRRAGVTPMVKRAIEIHAPAPHVPTPRERLLAALARMDWPTSLELFEAMELPDDCRSRERMAAAQMLSRLARLGFVEARAVGYGRAQYAVTARARRSA